MPRQRLPPAYLSQIPRRYFKKRDGDHDGSLSENEFCADWRGGPGRRQGPAGVCSARERYLELRGNGPVHERRSPGPRRCSAKSRAMAGQSRSRPIASAAWSSQRRSGKRARAAHCPIGSHVLGHTFCSHRHVRCAAEGDSGARGAHSTLAMTMRYMHLAPIALRGAIALLNSGQLMGNAANVGS